MVALSAMAKPMITPRTLAITYPSANSTALIDMCRHSSPLLASATIAAKICEGAARKSVLATR